ncbi:ParD-like family protein [Pectobacterium actinidiae]|uniref:ParD-like family protein n=1 Tax=Pectobacterium actinidiae TaxID=1507808 RepID=UPI0037F2AFBD
MGLVKISDALHENLRTGSAAFSRSINAQAEHWMRVGMLAELYPNLNYPEIARLLLQSEQMEGGLHALVAQLDERCSPASGQRKKRVA